MFKAIFNIFLILIICFSASGIPINDSYFDLPKFNFNTIKNKQNNENNYTYNANIHDKFIYNPTNIEFTMSYGSNKENFNTNNSQIVVEIYKNDNLIKQYKGSKIVKNIYKDKNKVKYILDISMENLNIKSGNYNIKIYSDAEKFSNIPPYKLSATYFSNAKYIGSKNSVDKKHMFITLFFPDKQAMYLVPISRKIPYTRKPIGKTIKNLQLGPKNTLGLSEGSPIPKILWKSIKGTTAIINLPSNADIYGSTGSYIALYSLINSITSIYGVDSIQFLVDGKKRDFFFHGIEIKKPFYPNTLPKAYLTLETDTKKFLLVPVEINKQNIDINDLIINIFNSLQKGYVNDYDMNYLTSTIPSNIRLIDFYIKENILNINFSKEFLNAYENRDDLKKMMIDSILYSFTSLPEVNKVFIKVEGKIINSFGDIDISKPLFPPAFINVEQ
ncbi:Sporulation and spore germination [Caminicella sporogenes DSM 14501]|uniref:Sporulation and spore germination n=1 Tax=Caminicella sporogenes DSM 14501 TaxID=1121266 RepID=A0A1M6RHS9_9FIRM|nr:GerMN domain-containing protein [Caminicella sporogenes]RKD25240.1 hypothetical protein BET04_03225 [Caminicella sporogenes]SHK32002.1 Sporulation and spore germination [Caminicella sporogenes DSM 14501]